jgi:UDP-N-acetylmuramyl pentapeptide phosphotransferase/UDP-N-acetylglucosamine-1-phosphate transferase
MVMGALIVMSQGLHGRHTLDHDLSGVQKFHTVAVPRIGGIAIVVALLLALFVRGGFSLEQIAASPTLYTAGLLLLAAVPAFAAGLVEDLTKKVSVRTRLGASIASALAASWLLGATLDQVDIRGLDLLLRWTPLAIAITALAVAGGVNSINIIDGFNGLASSTVAVILLGLCVVAVGVNDHLVAELALMGCGAAVGFLCINFPTGRLFLGDGGAYFLGFWVAEMAVLLLVRNPSVNAWQVLSICAYPIIEVFFSIYRRRFLRQASPGAPDGLHLHTLVYRRVVPKVFQANPARPWLRNAAVTCVVTPCVAFATFLGVLLGHTIASAAALVCVQVGFYVLAYRRIVRGRWRPLVVVSGDIDSENVEVNAR